HAGQLDDPLCQRRLVIPHDRQIPLRGPGLF
ncbi:MAG: hypothetical protein ACI89L_002551, partial [Phycisphaerales bacterium]